MSSCRPFRSIASALNKLPTPSFCSADWCGLCTFKGFPLRSPTSWPAQCPQRNRLSLNPPRSFLGSQTDTKSTQPSSLTPWSINSIRCIEPSSSILDCLHFGIIEFILLNRSIATNRLSISSWSKHKQRTKDDGEPHKVRPRAVEETTERKSSAG